MKKIKKVMAMVAVSFSLLQVVSPVVDATTVTYTAYESDWKSFYNLLKDGDESGRLVSNRRSGDVALTGRNREVINYSGEETVTIVVDKSVGEQIAQRKYKYEPNASEISKYFVSYVNQLRELNGITPRLSVLDSVTDFAQNHVNNMLKTMRDNNNFTTFHTNETLQNGQKVRLYSLWNGSQNHTSNGLVNYASTNVFALDMDKEYIYSDQEFAYHMVLSLYSNYSSSTRDWNAGGAIGVVDETYAYRYGLLFMDSAYAGVGAGYDHGGNLRSTQVIMGDPDRIGRDGVFYNNSRYYNAGKPGAIGFDSSGNMLYNGKQMRFLPHVKFKYVYKTTQNEQPVVNMYRLYNAKDKLHFYTSSNAEVRLLQSRGWILEGVAWRNSTSKDGIPVYRVMNKKTGERIFTRSKEELAKFQSFGWVNEGIAFRMPTNGQRIYRLRNKTTKRYVLSVKKSEVDKLVNSGQWVNEGTAFYGVLR